MDAFLSLGYLCLGYTVCDTICILISLGYNLDTFLSLGYNSDTFLRLGYNLDTSLKTLAGWQVLPHIAGYILGATYATHKTSAEAAQYTNIVCNTIIISPVQFWIISCIYAEG